MRSGRKEAQSKLEIHTCVKLCPSKGGKACSGRKAAWKLVCEVHAGFSYKPEELVFQEKNCVFVLLTDRNLTRLGSLVNGLCW